MTGRNLSHAAFRNRELTAEFCDISSLADIHPLKACLAATLIKSPILMQHSAAVLNSVLQVYGSDLSLHQTSFSYFALIIKDAL